MNPVGAKELPNSMQAFPDAFRELMEMRQISYRRLATRSKFSAGYLNHLACGTRPVPSDQVIKILAKALRVKPEYFFEYRQRGLQLELERFPELADRLYDYLVAGVPLPKDIKSTFEALRRTK